MKQHHSIIVAVLMALVATAPGQDPLLPGAPVPTTQTAMQKWLADLDTQWQAAFKRDVSDAFTAELDKLKIQYLTSVEAGINKASSAGDLNGAVALRSEQKRFSETNEVPAQDDAADALSVKQLRAAWRAQVARMEKDRATRAKALHAKYDQLLGQAQTQLTQAKRIDDALIVKAKREEIATAWLAGIPAAPPPAVAVEQPKPPTTVPIKPALPADPNTPAPALTATPAGGFTDVAAELKSKNAPKDVAACAIPFDAPGGGGRGGAKGILLINTPLTGKNGTTWSFTYIRQNDGGIQIIHPHGRGQVILHMNATEIGPTTPASWMQVGWSMGDAKRIKKGKGFSEIFPLKDAQEYHVLSKLDGQGGYELNINGKIVATGRVTTTSPLSIEIKEGLTYPEEDAACRNSKELTFPCTGRRVTQR